MSKLGLFSLKFCNQVFSILLAPIACKEQTTKNIRTISIENIVFEKPIWFNLWSFSKIYSVQRLYSSLTDYENSFTEICKRSKRHVRILQNFVEDYANLPNLPSYFKLHACLFLCYGNEGILRTKRGLPGSLLSIHGSPTVPLNMILMHPCS